MKKVQIEEKVINHLITISKSFIKVNTPTFDKKTIKEVVKVRSNNKDFVNSLLKDKTYRVFTIKISEDYINDLKEFKDKNIIFYSIEKTKTLKIDLQGYEDSYILRLKTLEE